MKHFGLVINSKKKDAEKVGLEIKKWLENKNVDVKLYMQHPPETCESKLPESLEALYREAELIIVLGGDGTLLYTARGAAPYQVPLLGINFGHLGFLTELELDNMYHYFEKLISGDYEVEERMMLACEIRRNGKTESEFLALNDVVITKGAFARLIQYDIFLDQQFVDRYPADGIIIASPTGSTAYSLSAGGPLISPEMDLMLLTPICPHTLYSRPIVISPKKKVRVVLKSDYAGVMLTVDGQFGYKLSPQEEIIVSNSSHRTRLVRISGKNFFDILRGKLRESSGQN